MFKSLALALSLYGSASNVDTISLGTSIHVDFVHSPHQMKQIPRFFDPEVIRAAFAHPTTGQRLCQFAKGTHSAADMEFLLKVCSCLPIFVYPDMILTFTVQVDEYMHALGSMTSLIGQISSDYTGLAATSPLELPPDMSNILRSNTKCFPKSVLN